MQTCMHNAIRALFFPNEKKSEKITVSKNEEKVRAIEGRDGHKWKGWREWEEKETKKDREK